MLILLLAAAGLLPQASAAAPRDTDRPAVAVTATARPVETAKCRKPTSYKAESGVAWRDQPVVPRKLDELPDATAYMAAYRTINGCEAPMTVVEYRDSAGH